MIGHANNRVRSDGRIIPLFCLVALASMGSHTTRAEERIFPLEEVSVFDLSKDVRHSFLLGQRVVCDDKADPKVTDYPKFTSAKPIYGAVDFSDPLGPRDGGKVYCFALDESGGTGTTYDRLYFDLSRDRSLTNDNALTEMKNPPQGATLGYSDVKQQTCFENLAIPFACGPEGERPLEMMPRLVIGNDGFTTLMLVTTRARKGTIELAGHKYDVLLGHCYIASGWFDKPWTALHLIPEGNTRPLDWWGGDRLNAMHKIGETFYTFSATPAGDKLMVRPYDGPFGTFEVGAGGRNIDRFEIMGSLCSQNGAVAVGEMINGNRPQYTRSWRLPVGDYLPEYVTLEYGKLHINISKNYHADGKPRSTTNRQWVRGIAIREDKPFVFDFSNKPAVMFAGPARDHRVKVGEELSVMAVLIDPVHDFMIRGLSVTGERRESLNPKVTICRASGEIVAEGVMPFG